MIPYGSPPLARLLRIIERHVAGPDLALAHEDLELLRVVYARLVDVLALLHRGDSTPDGPDRRLTYWWLDSSPPPPPEKK